MNVEADQSGHVYAVWHLYGGTFDVAFRKSDDVQLIVAVGPIGHVEARLDDALVVGLKVSELKNLAGFFAATTPGGMSAVTTEP